MKLIDRAIHKVSLKLLGSKYDCPFCHYGTRQLKTVGHDLPVLVEKEVIGGGKRAAGCPKCGSRDRERLLYAYLVNEENILNKKTTRILHIAPEPKISKVLLDNHFDEYICGDLFTEGYDYPKHECFRTSF